MRYLRFTDFNVAEHHFGYQNKAIYCEIALDVVFDRLQELVEAGDVDALKGENELVSNAVETGRNDGLSGQALFFKTICDILKKFGGK